LSAALGSTALPGLDLLFEEVAIIDAAVTILSAHDADLDLSHVEPACMAGCVVELQTSQDPARLGGWEGLVDC